MWVDGRGGEARQNTAAPGSLVSTTGATPTTAAVLGHWNISVGIEHILGLCLYQLLYKWNLSGCCIWIVGSWLYSHPINYSVLTRRKGGVQLEWVCLGHWWGRDVRLQASWPLVSNMSVVAPSSPPPHSHPEGEEWNGVSSKQFFSLFFFPFILS